jgi:hypothetical protein
MPTESCSERPTTGRKVPIGTNLAIFRGKGKKPHYTVLRCLSAGGTMLPGVFVVPGLKSAEIEWRRLVLDRRRLVKSPLTGRVNGRLFAWWLDGFRLGLGFEQHRGSDRSSGDEGGQPLPLPWTNEGAPSHAAIRALEACAKAINTILTFPPHQTQMLRPPEVSWA